MATVNLPAESNATSSIQLMAAGRQLILMLALAASVALGVVGAMWSWTPNYSLLYGSLGGKDATEVMSALQQSGISFRVDDKSGAVLVPSSKVDEARIKLAAAGLPKSSSSGYEILNEAPSFGTSRFLERARFQRAREVELGRSISTMNNIASARVHLASPPRSAFIRGGSRGSASAVVKLHPGRRMEEGQAWTIAHLIAAAMPGMEVGDIRVINDKGHLLNAPGSDDALAPNNQELSYRQRVEKGYLKKIQEILNPFVGLDGFRAQVALDMDFTRSERTRESFNPDLPAVESRQVVEQRDGGGAIAGGVPGALSNQPPGAGAAPEQAGGAGATEGTETANNFRREEIVNHRLDRTISHTRAAAGIVRRVSVAVVLDDRSITASGGKIERKAWTEEELQGVTGLVKDAIGFDASRGDSIRVINNRFIEPPAEEPLPEIPIWKQPWVWDLGKQASGIIFVLFLIFGVLRPIMRNLSSRAATSVAVVSDAAAEGGEPGVGGGTPAQQAGTAPGIQSLPGPAGAGHQTLDAAKAVVADDPKRVASVVKTWVSEGG